MKREPCAELIVDYDAAIAAVLAEVTSCGAGDRIVLCVYIIEPGASSERVLAELRAAAERGAQVAISVDATAASKLSRLWERTSTLLPQARALARDLPERVTAEGRRVPDHSKYALFLRSSGAPTALMGGVNLGDRFRPWRDFMVRLTGAEVVATLERRLLGEGAPPALAVHGSGGLPPVEFAVNLPWRSLFEVGALFRALAAEPTLRRFRLAMAYLDQVGAAVLRTMLLRGAEVELILPQQANVYHHANMRALSLLLRDAPGLRARLLPDMLHAKALLAWSGEGERLAFLGSTNLKRNSFRMLGELNALITERPFCDQLEGALERLWEEATPVEEPPRYNAAMARIEERFG